jgi:hypothetical protein
MVKFLLFLAVLAVVAYATLGSAGLSDILTFALVLCLALCVAAVYALAARGKRRSE